MVDFPLAGRPTIAIYNRWFFIAFNFQKDFDRITR
jgi:hypothetical protein